MTRVILAAVASALVMAHAPQTPAPSAIWERITYPLVAIPGSEREQLTFMVSSGGHTTGPKEEPSHLRLDMMWSGRDGAAKPAAIADGKSIVVKRHTAGGQILPSPPAGDWIGIGGGGYVQGSIITIFPWSRNQLDETWFEVRAGHQTWWLEVPYGFARNPEDAEVPDRTRGVPQFPPAMQPLGASDILVPWLDVRYDLGRTSQGWPLSLKVSNPFDMSAAAILYHEPPTRVGPDTSRWSLDSPRTGMNIEGPGRTLPGRELARRLSDDRHTRTDEFTFDRNIGPATGRSFGTLTVTIDGQSYGVRVPSSLVLYTHGRTDPANTKWIRVR